MTLPKLVEVDLRAVDASPVPMLQVAGRHDRMTPSALVEPWFEALDAPAKRLVWFERSAHMAMVEEPGRFLVEMLRFRDDLGLGTDAKLP